MNGAIRAPNHDVIVLAGGQGERLGGFDKALLEVGGVSLLTTIVGATTEAQRVAVVGPRREGISRVLWAPEYPPDGGPVAGIVAGLDALDASCSSSPWVLVLAVDQPGVPYVLPALLESVRTAATDADAVCPFDLDGDPIWLLSAYRRASLTRARRAIGSGHGVSVGRFVGQLRFEPSDARADDLVDVDTWADHRTWQNRLMTSPTGDTNLEFGT